MLGYEAPSSLPLREVHQRIVTLNDQLSRFWRHSNGWAPARASAILCEARLDWQVELSRSLVLFTEEAPSGEAQARLILGWTNLGTLVEGTLKLLLCVWADTYLESTSARNRNGVVTPPDVLTLEHLRQFIIAEALVPSWHAWIGHVQQRRNAVHAFRHRELGTIDEFRSDVTEYLRLLRDVNLQLPYPGEYVAPSEIDLNRYVRSGVLNHSITPG